MVSMKALECLVTIVDQGSLTKAAAVLRTSQSAGRGADGPDERFPHRSLHPG